MIMTSAVELRTRWAGQTGPEIEVAARTLQDNLVKENIIKYLTYPNE